MLKAVEEAQWATKSFQRERIHDFWGIGDSEPSICGEVLLSECHSTAFSTACCVLRYPKEIVDSLLCWKPFVSC